ncbi:DUF2752 domain-containing protein [Mycolicibacterium thermoresistibile]
MAPSAVFSSRGRLYGALAVGAVAVAAPLSYIGFADPHRAGFPFPACPFHLLTGWYCPGCGGLRMTHHLLHGELAAAAVDNVFLLVGLPILAVWLLVRLGLRRRLMPPVAAAVTVTAVLAWTVVRNLPGFPLLPTVLAG